MLVPKCAKMGEEEWHLCLLRVLMVGGIMLFCLSTAPFQRLCTFYCEPSMYWCCM